MGSTGAGLVTARKLITLAGAAVIISVAGPAVASAEVPGVAPSTPALEPEPKPLSELPELRTEDSKTYLLSDGARALRIYDHPVNFRASDGSWQPIEDQLVQRSDGSWQPQASPVPVRFPASLGSGPVSIGSGSHQLAFQLEGAASSEGAPAGALRVYRNVLPDTTITYTAAPQAVRETLTLSSAQAPTVYRYKLSLAPGLHATAEQGGSIAIQDGAGDVVYTLAPPSASDASPGRPFPTRAPVHYELSADGSTLSLVINKAWLDDPKRVFPVTIDPEAYFHAERDCSIISGAEFENVQECGSHLYVGPDSPVASAGIARSLLYFDTSSVPKSSVITQSSLRMYLAWDTTENPIAMEAHALTREFTKETTWNTYDGTHSWSTPGGDFLKDIAGERTFKNSEVGKELHFGFTPQVEQWVRDPTSNHGILLKARNETAPGYDAFAQTDNPEYAPEPTLEVIYEPRLGIPTMGQVYQQGLANGATMSVDVANGDLNVADPDVNYSSEGYDTELGRSYNSQDDLLEGASMGDWRLTKGDDEKLYQNEWDEATDFYGSDGSDTRFDRASWADGHPAAGDKAFTGEAGFNEGLIQHEAGTRTLSFPDGVEWKFNNSLWAEATEIVDSGGEGNTISLSYSEGRLSKLKDTHEHSITVTRNGSHDVTKLIGKGGEEWKYEYSSGRLVKYNGPGSVEAKYGYYPSGLLKDIVDSSGTWVISYDEQKRVSSIRKVVNGSIGAVGSEDEITSFSYETEQTTVTNPLGAKSYYYYDQFGNALEEPATQEAAAEFYAGYAEIEAEAARKDVDLQDHAAILDSELSQQLGSNYTGEWFDPGTKEIKIGLTSEGYEQTVTQDLDALGLADNAEIVTESASWSQLAAAEEAMSASLGTLVGEGLVVLGIEPDLDAVTVEKANSLTTAQTKQVSEAVAAATVPTHVTEASTPSVAAGASACGSGVCDKPLRGGVAIEAEAEKEGKAVLWHCTSGFIARSISDGKPYVLTAGHCIKDAGVGNAWWSKTHEPLTPHTIGKAHSYFYGNSQEVPGGTSEKGDAGLIAIESPSFWANPLEPLVIVYGSGEAGTTRNERYGIIGTKYNPNEPTPRLQFVVCSGGYGANLTNEGAYRQEESCGITQGFVSAVHYKEGETVHNLEKVNVCNSHIHELALGAGSSGSPVYKNHFAYGIHSGYKGACTFLYEGINTAESVLHVHIVAE